MCFLFCLSTQQDINLQSMSRVIQSDIFERLMNDSPCCCLVKKTFFVSDVWYFFQHCSKWGYSVVVELPGIGLVCLCPKVNL